MKYGVVYRVTNLETGKCYIGRTKRSLRQRWYDHCQHSSSCLYLKHAIEKYGKENFSIHEIASSWDVDNLKELERVLIIQENTLIPNGYNLINIGSISEISEEIRQKLRTRYNDRGEKQICSQCGNEFHEGNRRKNKSWGFFCSTKCYYAYKASKYDVEEILGLLRQRKSISEIAKSLEIPFQNIYMFVYNNKFLSDEYNGDKRLYDRPFIDAVVKRLENGERPTILSRELHIPRETFYQWKRKFGGLLVYN